ncbi:hypothetical protein FDUTEX481_01325 [Tolypothrix sp. PCC 7601]|nr:hypothetical protein FDUTEX481_01325 [Tolypothrix sp. PCC 7601]
MPPLGIRVMGINTCRLRAKGEGEKEQEKTFNLYPFTFSPN